MGIQNLSKTMNLSTKQYAQALYELTKDKPEKEVSVVVRKFVKNLKRNGLLNKVEDIVKKFTEVFNEENNIIEAKVVASRKLDDKALDNIERFLLKRYGAEKIEMKTKVDENLKGGIKIVVGEEVIDNSVSGRLQKLKQAMG